MLLHKCGRGTRSFPVPGVTSDRSLGGPLVVLEAGSRRPGCLRAELPPEAPGVGPACLIRLLVDPGTLGFRLPPCSLCLCGHRTVPFCVSDLLLPLPYKDP